MERKALQALREAPGTLVKNNERVGCGLVVAFLAFLTLRGCVPALNGNHVPAALETAVTEAYELR